MNMNGKIDCQRNTVGSEKHERSLAKPVLFTAFILILYALLQITPVKAQQVKKEMLPFDKETTSVTIFPISLAGKVMPMSKNVAQVMGLFLEQAGVMNIEISDTDFQDPPEKNTEQTGQLFAEFIQKNPVDTDYAIYGEFIGTPGKGVDEIRTFVTTKSGELVWSDSQTPESPTFRRIKPKDPMTCCVLMKERLYTKFGLHELKDPPKGNMARLWEAKSHLPPEEERAAIKKRTDQLKKDLKTATIQVFPVHIGDENSVDRAEHLATLMKKAGIGQAKVNETKMDFDVEGSSNQLRVVWDTAREFRKYLRENPPDADYALYADYMIGRKKGNPDEQVVGGVHLFICNQEGEWVMVDFQNNHHSDFQAVDPKSQEDCDRLVLRRLKRHLK